MMFAMQDYGTCLKALFAFAGMRDISNLVANFQPIEASVWNTVPMHIDFFARGADEETVIPLSKQGGDTADIRRLMCFSLAARSARMILKLAAGGIEGVANRNLNILMGVMLSRISVHDDLAARKRQMNRDMIDPTLAMLAVARFDHNLAGNNVVVKLLKLRHATLDLLSDGIRRIEFAKGDLRFQ